MCSPPFTFYVHKRKKRGGKKLEINEKTGENKKDGQRRMNG
jgi:hypothetical protein